MYEYGSFVSSLGGSLLCFYTAGLFVLPMLYKEFEACCLIFDTLGFFILAFLSLLSCDIGTLASAPIGR